DPESQRPLRDVSVNSNVRPARIVRAVTSDSEAQTSLTSDALDQMMRHHGHPGTTRIRPGSSDSTGSVIRYRGYRGREVRIFRRRADVIGQHGTTSMARIRRQGQAQNPHCFQAWYPTKGSRPGSPTPRAVRAGVATAGPAAVQTATKYRRSRQSSVTSFASELDSRFKMQAPGTGTGGMGVMGPDFGPNTDPRMIQAITQTMIGEFLWKYTRKTGRGDFSENRHRRYFWVHPYTRTLYWSERDPTTAGRAELKAKSVPIEAVRVVTDDNPMPPGLHRKSLVVISPGRTIKFTCTTGQRHETWFNALSYLLLRTTDDAQSDTEEMAGQITQEDVDEFNPQYGQRRAPLAATRTDTSALEMSLNIPTLTPARANRVGEQRPSYGTLTRLSGYWKSGQVFSSLRSRHTITPDIYETSEVHDSAEDLRAYFERQDRESDRLENVRACCDGKHDVGTLPRTSKRQRGGLPHTHSHASASAAPTPSSTTRSRV
ncbi:unnamed protein product, partial [Parascedosporium putredinis]